VGAGGQNRWDLCALTTLHPVASAFSRPFLFHPTSNVICVSCRLPDGPIPISLAFCPNMDSTLSTLHRSLLTHPHNPHTRNNNRRISVRVPLSHACWWWCAFPRLRVSLCVSTRGPSCSSLSSMSEYFRNRTPMVHPVSPLQELPPGPSQVATDFPLVYMGT
jgi:hypothetical protein